MKFKHVIFYFTGTGRVLLNAHEPVVQIISDNMEKTVAKISYEIIIIELNDDLNESLTGLQRLLEEYDTYNSVGVQKVHPVMSNIKLNVCIKGVESSFKCIDGGG